MKRERESALGMAGGGRDTWLSVLTGLPACAVLMTTRPPCLCLSPEITMYVPFLNKPIQQ